MGSAPDGCCLCHIHIHGLEGQLLGMTLLHGDETGKVWQCYSTLEVGVSCGVEQSGLCTPGYTLKYMEFSR